MRALLCAALFSGVSPATAQPGSVLFIGNSYTYVNDLPGTVRQLALSLGHPLEVSSSAPAGFTLEQHYDHAPTTEAILSRPWDVVVLQEQSQLPAFPDGTALAVSFGAARLLVERIKAAHECTLPVFYMTWGRENGDRDNCAVWPPVCTFEGMQQLLRERYLLMGLSAFGHVSPVGVAWQRVREQFPAIELYADDGSHPSLAGTYLAACVFYATLFRESPAGAAYTAGLSVGTAATLQAVAASTVLGEPATWMLDTSPGLSAELMRLDTPGNDTYVFYHPGHGTFQWQCSDGQTSTEAQPSFVLPPGDHVMTLIYTDLCGIVDTAAFPFTAWHEGTIAVDELDAAPFRVIPVAGALEVQCPAGRSDLRLFDLHGRLVSEAHWSGGSLRVTCPPGAYLWELNGCCGDRATGRAVVP